MNVNANEDLGLLSDEELDARQRAVDGEAADHNPTAEAEPPAGETLEAAAAPAAGAEPKPETDKIVGVASKDGGRVLPYAALQAERRSARAASGRAERAEQELQAAQKLIADLRAGITPDAEVTEADVADMEANFPEQGKKMRALFERSQASAAPAPAQAAAEEPSDDPVQEAIDQVPLLLEWQHGDVEKFGRAQEIDAVLLKSPKWRDKPSVDRFTEVARMVADEYDVPFTSPKTSTAASPAAPAAAPAMQRRQPETLSDFKGGSIADHGSIDANRVSPQQLLARMADMTDEQIDEHLAKYGQ